jgi:hypothetical protein
MQQPLSRTAQLAPLRMSQQQNIQQPLQIATQQGNQNTVLQNTQAATQPATQGIRQQSFQGSRPSAVGQNLSEQKSYGGTQLEGQPRIHMPRPVFPSPQTQVFMFLIWKIMAQCANFRHLFHSAKPPNLTQGSLR